MAWSEADLDALDNAIKGNVRKVTFADGRSVEYHDISQMLAVRREIRAEVASSISRGRVRTVVGKVRRSCA